MNTMLCLLLFTINKPAKVLVQIYSLKPLLKNLKNKYFFCNLSNN